MPKFCRISIEGLMGVGKSHYLETFKSMFNANEAITITEAVDVYRNCENHNILSAALEGGRPEQVLALQMLALDLALRPFVYSLDETKGYVISERCALTQKEVFWKSLSETHKISAQSLAVLSYMYTRSDDETMSKFPDIIIYIKDTPEKCLERIKKRGRPEELSYTIDDMRRLDRLHRDYITAYSRMIKIIEIDRTGKSEEEMEYELDKAYAQCIKHNEMPLYKDEDEAEFDDMHGEKAE